MSKAPSMPMFWDAYLADTTHLTTEEHGAYMLLLAAMWRRNGWVPDDDRDNARILGLTVAKWKRTKARLASFLIFDENCISQKNLLKIWKNTQEKIAVNASNGAKGGRPKANVNNDLPKANGSIPVKPIVTIPEPEPYIEDDEDSAGEREDENPAGNLEAGQAESASSKAPLPDLTEREMILAAIGYKPNRGVGHTANGAMIGSMADMREYQGWRDDLNLTWDDVMGTVSEVIAKRADTSPPTSFRYFTKAMKQLAADKARPAMQPDQTPAAGKGSRNERAATHQRFDDTLNETIRRLNAGEIELGSGRRDPFGG